MIPTRVYAYGGTTHAVRWPCRGLPALPELHEDTHGMRMDRDSYGCVIVQDEAFLLVRRYVSAGDRVYPYVLMIRPPGAMWTAFDCNAADMLRAIIADSACHEYVFNPPDSPSEDVLTDMLLRLRPDNAAVPMPPLPAVSAWWAASFQAGKFRVSPAEIGWPASPSLEQVSAVVRAMPSTLRTARGWLIGGGRNVTRVIGVGLVVDEEPNRRDEVVLDDELARGMRLATAWSMLEDKAILGSELDALSEKPVWRWQETWGIGAEGIASRLLALAEDSEPAASDAPESSAGPLGHAMASLRFRALLRSGGARDEAERSRLLEMIAADPTRLSADVISQLAVSERSDVVRMLVRRRTLTRSTLLLLADESVWPVLLSGLRQDEVFAVLGVAIAADESGPISDRFRKAAVASAIAALRGAPLAWLNQRENVALWPAVADDVRQFARDTCLDEGARFPETAWTYLALADDPSTEWLASGSTPGRQAAVFKALASGAAPIASLAAPRRLWLDAAARTAVRGAADIDSKISVARELRGAWRWLAQLADVVDGAEPLVLEAAPADEFALLSEELEPVLARSSLLIAVPNPESVLACLGPGVDDATRQRCHRIPADCAAQATRELLDGSAEAAARLVRSLGWTPAGRSVRDELLVAVTPETSAAGIFRLLETAPILSIGVIGLLGEHARSELLAELGPRGQSALERALCSCEQDAGLSALAARVRTTQKHKSRPGRGPIGRWAKKLMRRRGD